METLYMRTAKDEAERHRLHAALYKPPKGKAKPKPRSTRSAVIRAKQVLAEMEREDRELGIG